MKILGTAVHTSWVLNSFHLFPSFEAKSVSSCISILYLPSPLEQYGFKLSSSFSDQIVIFCLFVSFC